MSGIVLSASVRQNLLSLQSTADLLATTQNRLATGKKVNTALDNPTNFFTARALDSRASDISNLLDGISNGVQVLQAANTGINSLQKLLDSAKSIANQALQTTVGYSTKSNVSTTIAGATSGDLRGTTTFTSAVASSNVLYSGAAGGATAANGTTTLGGVIGTFTGTAATAGDGSTALVVGITLLGTGTNATSLASNAAPADGDTVTVNGKTITFRSGDAPGTSAVASGSGVSGNIVTDGSGNSTIYLGTSGTPDATVGDLLTAIDLASGVRVAVNSGGAATISTAVGQTNSSIGAGAVTLRTSTGADLSVSGEADLLNALGLTTSVGSGAATVTVARTTSSATIGSLMQNGSALYVNGKTINFVNAPTPGSSGAPSVESGSGRVGSSALVTDGNGNSTVYLQAGTIDDVLNAIDIATGVQTVAIASGAATLTTSSGMTASSIATNGTLKLSTGTAADLAITGSGNALTALGLGGNTGTNTSFMAARTATAGSLDGKTLTFSSFNGGTAVDVTFGDGTNGTVKTLNDLNAALTANNMMATLDSSGLLTISAGNDYASSTLGSAAAGGAIGGTATSVLTFTPASAPVADASAQNTRSSLVSQYNNILAQITTTAQDASFNGVNLLNGDQLKLVFNETGSSVLNITGVTFNSSGLGLASLSAGVDFIDNAATNNVLAGLTSASTLLRSQASTLGSNLSIVQTRQSFSKELIGVLQTGSSNLTLADTNEEAANSQALTTRQSIAVSALGLATQAQQSVLQLLR
jgi:flagellin-like hook-associated protein FlgL